MKEIMGLVGAPSKVDKTVVEQVICWATRCHSYQENAREGAREDLAFLLDKGDPSAWQSLFTFLERQNKTVSLRGIIAAVLDAFHELE